MSDTATTELRFSVGEGRPQVSALLTRSRRARQLLVLGHGAGAGMRHVFMEAISGLLGERGVATLRYQFPYMEVGRRRPDPAPVLVETVRAAVRTAAREAPDLPLLAGGKSMGGRMTSTAASLAPLPGVRGLAFFGFPLHAAGKPASARGDHLIDVALPMLFLQGDRDRLADLDLLEPLVARLGERATLHVEPSADHSFHVLKRSGRDPQEVLGSLANRAAAWAAAVT